MGSVSVTLLYLLYTVPLQCCGTEPAPELRYQLQAGRQLQAAVQRPATAGSVASCATLCSRDQQCAGFAVHSNGTCMTTESLQTVHDNQGGLARAYLRELPTTQTAGDCASPFFRFNNSCLFISRMKLSKSQARYECSQLSFGAQLAVPFTRNQITAITRLKHTSNVWIWLGLKWHEGKLWSEQPTVEVPEMMGYFDPGDRTNGCVHMEKENPDTLKPTDCTSLLGYMCEAPGCSGVCPPGWVAALDDCYRVHDESVTFSEVAGKCLELHALAEPGKVAVPGLPTTVSRVLWQWTHQGLWTGHTDAADEGNWEAGLAGEFMSGEPNGGHFQNCIALGWDGIWDDICSLQKQPLCQMPQQPCFTWG